MKKKNNYPVLIGFLLIGVLGLSACSKDDIIDTIIGDQRLSMKVDGRDWNATITTLFTQKDGDGEQGEYYTVAIGGSKEVGKGEDEVDMFIMYITIPASKYQNPKGRYPISHEASKVNQATSLFSQINELWEARHLANDAQSVGFVEITDFKIGEQIVSGQPTGVEGYTRLVGTFATDMVLWSNPSGSALKITEGKFDLKPGVMITH